MSSAPNLHDEVGQNWRPLATPLIPAPPIEAQYGGEFYRNPWKLLGEKSFLTSECRGVGASGVGGFDFVAREAKWGIKILQGGDNLREYLSRFEPGGQCHG